MLHPLFRNIVKNVCLCTVLSVNHVCHASQDCIFKLLDGKGHSNSSPKTVNTRENFWNVYCFTTSQMRDEIAKVNPRTAAWISHKLTRNNKLASLP